jgi:hypothetical protein
MTDTPTNAALARIFDAIEHQLTCADEYARQNKPVTDLLPSVWEIQNGHIRDLLAEARTVCSSNSEEGNHSDEPKNLKLFYVDDAPTYDFVWAETAETAKKMYEDSRPYDDVCVGHVVELPTTPPENPEIVKSRG